jgi:hypothetical protein
MLSNCNDSRGQTGLTPFLVLAGLLLLSLGFVTLALLSEPLTEVIRGTVEQSDDGAVNFFVMILPFFVVLLLLGYGVYIISSGGGDL